ncbi:MAG: acyl-CoA ligase (AMP-forming), exosortase A system-associated [Colwellia sp.]
MHQITHQSLHSLILHQASIRPNDKALGDDESGWLTYQDLQAQINKAVNGFNCLGLKKNSRVAIYLPKSIKSVVSIFSTCAVGGIFVPINPVLKGRQVSHIITDCGAEILITNTERYQQISNLIPKSICRIILTNSKQVELEQPFLISWQQFIRYADYSNQPSLIVETDIAAIFYTSGSTGAPKGVVLSHRNMVAGAQSVAQYLLKTPEDCVLSVLPHSFDYGFSQLTTSFCVGASCYLMEYLFPHDIIKKVAIHNVTGLSLLPTLWSKLAQLDWPQSVVKQLRYYCNSGGAMPMDTLQKLRKKLPYCEPYLMYGLTEAFRSCYLPPKEVELRPNSFGKAIPNARIYVINEVGEECLPGEPGELVHCGPLVAQGYWNDPKKTAERFKVSPFALAELNQPEIAVWSGDIVKKDEEGFFYYISRNDDLIKTSGYRVSATEIEEVLYACAYIEDAVVVSCPHPELSQAIIAVITISRHSDLVALRLSIEQHIAVQLPSYMRPKVIDFYSELPKTPNGKFDRNAIKSQFANYFV